MGLCTSSPTPRDVLSQHPMPCYSPAPVPHQPCPPTDPGHGLMAHWQLASAPHVCTYSVLRKYRLTEYQTRGQIMETRGPAVADSGYKNRTEMVVRKVYNWVSHAQCCNDTHIGGQTRLRFILSPMCTPTNIPVQGTALRIPYRDRCTPYMVCVVWCCWSCQRPGMSLKPLGGDYYTN